MRLRTTLTLWLLFFAVCLGLGFPTLSRFDPRSVPSLADTASYYRLVEAGPGAVSGHWRYRVLVPAVARPVYLLARGRSGNWDPVALGLLCANSLFCATTALLIVRMGLQATGDGSVGLLAGALYLLNFLTPNAQLAGLVDSSESCALAAVCAALLAGRPAWLPAVFVLGALGKETSVPIAIVLAGAWCVMAKGSGVERRRMLIWTGAAILAGLAAATVLISTIAGEMVWPWKMASVENSHMDPLASTARIVFSGSTWYGFAWLVPLAIPQLRRLPRAWVIASLAAAGCALALSIYRDARANAARPIFNAAAPVLCVAAASFLVRLTREGSRGERAGLPSIEGQ